MPYLFCKEFEKTLLEVESSDTKQLEDDCTLSDHNIQKAPFSSLNLDLKVHSGMQVCLEIHIVILYLQPSDISYDTRWQDYHFGSREQ